MVKVTIHYTNLETEIITCNYCKPKEGFFLIAQTEGNIEKRRFIPASRIEQVISESEKGNKDME